MEYVLKVEPRSETARAVHRVRAQGYVPGVVYGQGKDATPLQFKELDLTRLLRAGGASQLFSLQGLSSQPVHALLREVQRHPTRRSIMHVDFYQVQMDVAVRTEVPVHFEGESPAIKGGAVLIHHLDRIEIECLPGKIPDAFHIDLASLQTADDEVRVKDLTAPEGVAILSDPEEVVVSLTIPRALVEEEAGAEVAEPEVIVKGKVEQD